MDTLNTLNTFLGYASFLVGAVGFCLMIIAFLAPEKGLGFVIRWTPLKCIILFVAGAVLLAGSFPQVRAKVGLEERAILPTAAPNPAAPLTPIPTSVPKSTEATDKPIALCSVAGPDAFPINIRSAPAGAITGISIESGTAVQMLRRETEKNQIWALVRLADNTYPVGWLYVPYLKCKNV